MEPLRLRLDNRHPFIVENGGALFIPMGYFPFPLEQAAPRGDYEVVEIGTPYVRLRTALKEIGGDLGCRLRGFGDLSLEEVSDLTGLSPAETLLATQREYDEPVVVESNGMAWNRLSAAAAVSYTHLDVYKRQVLYCHDTLGKGRAKFWLRLLARNRDIVHFNLFPWHGRRQGCGCTGLISRNVRDRRLEQGGLFLWRSWRSRESASRPLLYRLSLIHI